MTNVKRISPMLAVANMQDTICFYREVLKFDIDMQSPEYSIISKNGSTVHLMKAENETVMAFVRGHTEIYIEVDDITSLWSHVQSFSGQFKINGLVHQPYGMTEFHIGDSNDCLVFVGQPTKTQ